MAVHVGPWCGPLMLPPRASSPPCPQGGGPMFSQLKQQELTGSIKVWREIVPEERGRKCQDRSPHGAKWGLTWGQGAP